MGDKAKAGDETYLGKFVFWDGREVVCLIFMRVMAPNKAEAVSWALADDLSIVA